jgi:acyl carrier protein
MTVSSRTPEGTPNRCPVCGKNVWVEPALLFGDAPCSHCGSLLWFLRLASETRFYEEEEAESVRERVIETVANFLEVNDTKVRNDPRLSFLAELNLDSMEIADLMLELEDELKK